MNMANRPFGLIVAEPLPGISAFAGAVLSERERRTRANPAPKGAKPSPLAGIPFGLNLHFKSLSASRLAGLRSQAASTLQ